ncbi:MAG: thioredoxin [Flavobacteriia bacterium]|nr:MAG: thioredoxin [Flavobacteriia bacterium]
MKKSFYLLLLVSALSLAFKTDQSEPFELYWETDFDHALTLANETNKPLLVFFTGSDWCGPCKMLEKDFFQSEKFQHAATNDLVLYKADFPRRRDLITPEQKKQNALLSSKYGVRGYPTIVILNGQGHMLEKQVGYNRSLGADEHFKMLDRVTAH